MTATKRVLFICTGNTCRSPMAEALFQKALLEKGEKERDEYSVKSAGVAASKNCECSRETDEIVRARGASLVGFKSSPVTEALLEEATHVFTMTSGHLAVLEDLFPEFSEKYYLACEFVALPGRGLGADVPDPIGMGKAAYEDVASVMEVAIPAIISYIDQTTPGVR